MGENQKPDEFGFVASSTVFPQQYWPIPISMIFGSGFRSHTVHKKVAAEKAYGSRHPWHGPLGRCQDPCRVDAFPYHPTIYPSHPTSHIPDPTSLHPYISHLTSPIPPSHIQKSLRRRQHPFEQVSYPWLAEKGHLFEDGHPFRKASMSGFSTTSIPLSRSMARRVAFMCGFAALVNGRLGDGIADEFLHVGLEGSSTRPGTPRRCGANRHAGSGSCIFEFHRIVDIHDPEGFSWPSMTPCSSSVYMGQGMGVGLAPRGLPMALLHGRCHDPDFKAGHVLGVVTARRLLVRFRNPFSEKQSPLNPLVSRLVRISAPRGPSRMRSAWALSLNRKG